MVACLPSFRVELGEFNLVRSDRTSVAIVDDESGAGGPLID